MSWRVAMAAAMLAAWCGAARAEAIDWKLTLGRYASSDHNDAVDANLRGSRGDWTGWLGVYRDRSGLQQWRSGLEVREVSGSLSTLFSLQSASGGVAVGAVTAQFGGTTYAILGWGRTNLRNYVNLNYDPNDAVTLGLGTKAWDGAELSLFTVRDDRLHTGQQVTHLLWRQTVEGKRRLTLDLFTKRGLDSDGVFVRGDSLSLTWDEPAWFVRVAHDPHAGFTGPTQNRVSVGARF